MKVTLTSPVEGKQPGDQVTVDAERGEWLITNGYATRSGEDKAGDDKPATKTAARAVRKTAAK